MFLWAEAVWRLLTLCEAAVHVRAEWGDLNNHVQETCDLRESEAGSRWELQFTRREKEMLWMKQLMIESISCLPEKQTNKQKQTPFKLSVETPV